MKKGLAILLLLSGCKMGQFDASQNGSGGIGTLPQGTGTLATSSQLCSGTYAIGTTGTVVQGSRACAATATGASVSLTVTALNTVINDYALVTDAVVSVGATAVSVDSAAAFATGDEVMILQTQGATAGTYELKTLSGASGTTLTFATSLASAYTSNAVGTTRPNAKVTQVVRIPHYVDVTVNSGASLTATAWNGSKGGVLAFRASGVLTLTGDLDVSGKGFRGGAAGVTAGCGYPWPTQAGDAGESIYGRTNYTACNRSATSLGDKVAVAASGGAGGGGAGTTGTARNGGGGGGASLWYAGTSGGVSTTGEAGGAAGSTRATLGLSSTGLYLGSGGGGGGSGVNSSGGAGGAGGGIIYVSASSVTTQGLINAEGATGGAGSGGDDGGGGGGGGSGGTIAIGNVTGDTWAGAVAGGPSGAPYGGNYGSGGAGGKGGRGAGIVTAN